MFDDKVEKRKKGIDPEEGIRYLPLFYGVVAICGIIAYIVITFVFNVTATNDIPNSITLIIEIGAGVAITLTVYLYSKRQYKENKRISKFFDNQIEFVREDIGRCLTNIFSGLYSTSDKIEDLEYKKCSKGGLSSNIQTIEFHYLHNTMYLDSYKAITLPHLISQMKHVNEGKSGIFPLLNNIILSLERGFPNRYTQEIDYLIHDFIKKHNERYPQYKSLQNLSLFNPDAKQPYNEFIKEKVYDIKALPDWVLTHLKHPGLKDVNSFVPRIESRVESLHYIKNNDRVENLQTHEIAFLIEIYEGAKKIFEIDYLGELNLLDLQQFIANLKKFVELYGDFMYDD